MRYLIAFLLMPLFLNGQSRYPVAVSGPNRVFVQVTNVLHGPRYRIERQLAASGNWQPIYTTDLPPDSPGALADRVLMLAEKHPSLSLPTDSTLKRMWPHYQHGATTDSLYGYGQHPLLLEALGLGFMDVTVQPGQRYEYRVVPLGEATERLLQAARPAGIPGPKQPFGLKFVRANATGKEVYMTFLITRPTATLGGVRVQRSVFAQTRPKDVSVVFGFRRSKKDSLLVELVDRNVQRRVTYQYVVSPTDFVGNEGSAADTLTLTNLRPQDDLPAIMSVEANSVEAQQHIRLSWRLSANRDLREIKILRATEFDGPYLQIGSARATDTSYIDRRVVPIQSYFYQLILNGMYDQSTASVRFPGLLKATRSAVLAPRNFFITQTKDEITLRWQRPSINTHGYYLYRSDRATGSLQQAGDIIRSVDSTVVFTIKTNSLAPSPIYRFAVASVNTSYAISQTTDTLSAQLILPARMVTPLNPVALRVDRRRAQLIWDDMTLFDSYIQGYVIYRKESQEKEFSEIYRQKQDDLAHNSFIDSSVVVGKSYQYRVRAYGLSGVESAMSSAATFALPLPVALKPRGLCVFATMSGAEIAWDAPSMAGLDKFNVYRYRAGERPALLVSTVSTMTRFSDKGVPSPGLYYYAIASVDKAGQESPLSDPVGVNW